MTTLTISPKFHIVIPKAIREMLGLRPGQKVRRMKDMCGFLRGIDTSVSSDS